MDTQPPKPSPTQPAPTPTSPVHVCEAVAYCRFVAAAITAIDPLANPACMPFCETWAAVAMLRYLEAQLRP